MKFKRKQCIQLPEPVPVYDLTVDGYHNFGVVTDNNHLLMAHNCASYNLDM